MENMLFLCKEKSFFKFNKQEEKKLNKKEKAKLEAEAIEILNFLKETKEKLDYTELCLNFTSDELMIDSFIYESLSLRKKLDYYLKLSKEKGISINKLNVLKKISVE